MRWTRFFGALFLLLAVCVPRDSVSPRPCESAQKSAAPVAVVHPIDIAITVDDLPDHGPALPNQTRLAIHQAFLVAFRAHHVPPVYGFVVGGPVDTHPDDRAALEAWVAAGNPLGNHTRTHPDLHETTVDAYLRDLDANEALLRGFSRGGDERTWKVFRYPFLQEGTDLDSRARLRQAILSRGYRIAEVTIDFYDWAYNDPYVRCVAKHDGQAIAALKKSYFDYATGALSWADSAARTLVHRPIEQVLLLHIGSFDAVVIDELLTRYEKLGVHFVSLDQALADPIYTEEPKTPASWEGTFLSQVAEARGDDIPEPTLPEPLLDALCR